MCKTALALRFNGRKRHAICSRRGGRLVQRTAGRRRSRRDSRLIVKTSPRFTVNWPALASSILEDSGPVFTNRRCGAISPVRSVPDPPASTAPRAREGIKTHALIVLSWSKATRDLLKSLGWGIRALHQLATATMVPSPRPCPYHLAAGRNRILSVLKGRFLCAQSSSRH